MKTFFKEIFEYHHQTNQKLIRQLIAHKDQLSERTIPLLSHTINAHQIWNARILKMPCHGVFDVHGLEKCLKFDIENFENTLAIIDSFEITLIVSYQDSKGKIYKNEIKDILYHIGNHFTHHRGQLISDLRQNDIAPILTDYIFFKR